MPVWGAIDPVHEVLGSILVGAGSGLGGVPRPQHGGAAPISPRGPPTIPDLRSRLPSSLRGSRTGSPVSQVVWGRQRRQEHASAWEGRAQVLCIQGDRIVLREAKEAKDGRALHGVHGGRVLDDRMREAVTPKLGKHPAHHGDGVDEDTAVSADASSALEAARHGEVLAWAAGNHKDQRA